MMKTVTHKAQPTWAFGFSSYVYVIAFLFAAPWKDGLRTIDIFDSPLLVLVGTNCFAKLPFTAQRQEQMLLKKMLKKYYAARPLNVLAT